MKQHVAYVVSGMRLWLVGLALYAILLTGCAEIESTEDVEPNATPAESGLTNQPSPKPDASPTVLPSGEYLEIEGERALAVIIPAGDIGAEYAITADALYRQTDRTTWSRVADYSSSQNIIADPADTDVLYRGGHPGCDIGGEEVPFEKSIDGGESWRELSNGRNIRPLLSTGGRHGVIYGERCQLAISTDGGHTWTTHQTMPGFWIDNVALADSWLYILHSSAGGTSRLSVVDVSTPERAEIGDKLLEFWGRGIVSASQDKVLVGEPQGVRISHDGGRTWSLSRERLEDVTISVDALVEPIPREEIAGEYGVLAIATHPQSPERIYIGTVRGLFLSEDNGQTWGRLPEVREISVRNLAFAHDGGQLYVTTNEGVAIVKNP